MRARFIKGITAGAVIGAAAGFMAAPKMKRSTRKRIIRGSKRFLNTAEDVYDSMMNYRK